MDAPTLDDVRSAKTELVQRLRSHGEFAGAGIGQQDGQLVVRVNWRVLPRDIDLPQRLGNVAVTHHEVGTIRAQAKE